MRIKLIYNPMAGRGRASRHHAEAERHLRALGAEVDVHASTSPADMTQAAADASRGTFDRVVVCGGDGTLHLSVREFDLANG
ncbi:MAG TPA: acylglycerol kinase family protein, partial [Thermoanaerobaculia bacterium]|nr:acylglycerol kinase family protein [Thermoanaerobaculia bacterium]